MLICIKKKEIFISSIESMLFSFILVMIFTPLERYVSMSCSYMNGTSIFLGCILYSEEYANSIITGILLNGRILKRFNASIN